jgi:phytol kinase
MATQFSNLLVLGTAYLILFALCEYLWHKQDWDTEHTRKVAHAGSGIMALSFPYWFSDVLFVAVLCSTFLLILALTKRSKWLRSIHAVKRETYGSTMFPLVVCICFWLYSREGKIVLFYLPILIMALADPAACLVGRRYPILKMYKSKSLGGSLAFFTVAFVLSMGAFVWLRPTDWHIFLPRCLAIAAACTTAEAVTQKGFDNLSIPLSALGVLLIFDV